MRKLVSAAVMALLALPALLAWGAAATGPVPPPASPEVVKKLVAQLGAEGWADRQAAQDRLVGMGPEVVPLLEPLAGAAGDEEMRSRMQEILRQINRADVAHPTPITLHKKDVPLKEVLADLARQADTEIVSNPATLLADSKDAITIDADHEAFWNVALAVCRQAHVTPAKYGGIGLRTITLIKGEEPPALAAPTSEGCFHITPESATSGGTVANRTILAFRMLIDPKLTVLRGTTFIRCDEVLDAQGKSLKFEAPFSSDDFTAYYNWNCRLASHIYTPTEGPVAHFKGTVRVQVQEKVESWEVADPLTAKGASHNFPGGKYGLTGVTAVDTRQARTPVLYPLYAVKCGFDGAAGQDAGATMLGGNVRLGDAAGQITRPAVFGPATLKNGHADFTTSVGAITAEGKRLGAITRLIWEVPVGIREIVVPVEFRNLPVK